MPAFVIASSCDGCAETGKPACVEACPNDLMARHGETLQAYNRDAWLCWECFSCGKVCPRLAIDIRGSADFVPLGASVIPVRTGNRITWAIKFRNGTRMNFVYPARTTVEGTAVPHGGFGPDRADDLNGPYLFTEPASIGTELPMPNIKRKGEN